MNLIKNFLRKRKEAKIKKMFDGFYNLLSDAVQDMHDSFNNNEDFDGRISLYMVPPSNDAQLEQYKKLKYTLPRDMKRFEQLREKFDD